MAEYYYHTEGCCCSRSICVEPIPSCVVEEADIDIDWQYEDDTTRKSICTCSCKDGDITISRTCVDDEDCSGGLAKAKCLEFNLCEGGPIERWELTWEFSDEESWPNTATQFDDEGNEYPDTAWGPKTSGKIDIYLHVKNNEIDSATGYIKAESGIITIGTVDSVIDSGNLGNHLWRRQVGPFEEEGWTGNGMIKMDWLCQQGNNYEYSLLGGWDNTGACDEGETFAQFFGWTLESYNTINSSQLEREDRQRFSGISGYVVDMIGSDAGRWGDFTMTFVGMATQAQEEEENKFGDLSCGCDKKLIGQMDGRDVSGSFIMETPCWKCVPIEDGWGSTVLYEIYVNGSGGFATQWGGGIMLKPDGSGEVLQFWGGGGPFSDPSSHYGLQLCKNFGASLTRFGTNAPDHECIAQVRDETGHLSAAWGEEVCWGGAWGLDQDPLEFWPITDDWGTGARPCGLKFRECWATTSVADYCSSQKCGLKSSFRIKKNKTYVIEAITDSIDKFNHKDHWWEFNFRKDCSATQLSVLGLSWVTEDSNLCVGDWRPATSPPNANASNPNNNGQVGYWDGEVVAGVEGHASAPSATYGWNITKPTVSDTEIRQSIRFRIEDSENCKLSSEFTPVDCSYGDSQGPVGNPKTQTGVATATIENRSNGLVNFGIDFKGWGEAQDSGYEHIEFFLNDVSIGRGEAVGGKQECAMAPIQAILPDMISQEIPPGTHTLRVEFSTNDGLYHVGGYYQIDVRLYIDLQNPSLGSGAWSISPSFKLNSECNNIEDPFGKRRRTHGGQVGDVVVTLLWDSLDDVDLWVTEPSGESIGYSNSRSATGGRLDIDMNVGCRDSSGTMEPIENIFWPVAGAPSGQYTVKVNLFKWCSGAPVPFSVQVKYKSGSRVVTRVYEGILSYAQETVTVATFNV